MMKTIKDIFYGEKKQWRLVREREGVRGIIGNLLISQNSSSQ